MYVCIKCRVGDLTTLGRFAGSMSVDLQLSRYVNADSAFILYVLYVCMCFYVVCMYTCMFVHLFIHVLYVCMHLCCLMCTYVCMYVCMMYYEVCVYEVQDRVFVNGFMHCMYVG